MTEAMGMSLPGCAAIPAVDAAKLRIARESGERIIDLVRGNIRPRDIITIDSLTNAIRVDMALGGSTNTVLHLMAIALEAEVPLDIDRFNEIGEITPHICHMQPSGPHSMQTLYRAGGIPGVFKEALNTACRYPDSLGVECPADCEKRRCPRCKHNKGYQFPGKSCRRPESSQRIARP